MTHREQGDKKETLRAESLQQRLERLQRAMHALEREIADVAQAASTGENMPGASAVHTTVFEQPRQAATPPAMAPSGPAVTGKSVAHAPTTHPEDGQTSPSAPPPTPESLSAVKPQAQPAPDPGSRSMLQGVQGVDDKTGTTPGKAKVPKTAELSPADRLAHLLGHVSQPENLISATERRLALDALGLLLLRVPEALQEQVVERLCVMREPPRALLEMALLTLPDEHVARLLAEAHMSDAFLADIARTGNTMAQECILQRRHLGPATCAALAEVAPGNILKRLLAHQDAPISDAAWRTLLLRAIREPGLQPFLVRHAQLPLPVANELFWHMPSELRAELLARGSGESTLLEELLTLAHAPGQLPAQAFLERMEVAFGAILQRDVEGAVVTVASATGLRLQTIRRILADEGGEAMAILFKGHQVPARTFLQTMIDHAQGHLGRRWPWLHDQERLMDFYGGVGIARARLMLLYWDWRSRQSGPYAAYPPLEEKATAVNGESAINSAGH